MLQIYNKALLMENSQSAYNMKLWKLSLPENKFTCFSWISALWVIHIANITPKSQGTPWQEYSKNFMNGLKCPYFEFGDAHTAIWNVKVSSLSKAIL